MPWKLTHSQRGKQRKTDETKQNTVGLKFLNVDLLFRLLVSRRSTWRF